VSGESKAEKGLDISRERLRPPEADAPPRHFQAWYGRIAEALQDGKELPPETAAALAGRLEKLSKVRFPEMAPNVLGLIRKPGRPERRNADIRKVRAAVSIALFVEELRRLAGYFPNDDSRARYQRAFRALKKDSIFPSDWTTRTPEFLRALGAWVDRSKSNREALREVAPHLARFRNT
jgi:hypothetical protein